MLLTIIVCAIIIIKVGHARTGKIIKSNVTFARTFRTKEKLITLTI